MSSESGFQHLGQRHSVSAVAASERLRNIRLVGRTLVHTYVFKFKWYCENVEEGQSIYLFQNLTINQDFTINHRKNKRIHIEHIICSV